MVAPSMVRTKSPFFHSSLLEQTVGLYICDVNTTSVARWLHLEILLNQLSTNTKGVAKEGHDEFAA